MNLLYRKKNFDFFLIKDLFELEKIKNEWISLTNSISKLPPSLDYDWIFSWWESYGEKYELNIYCVFKYGSLKAVFPTMISKFKNDYILGFLSNSCSDYLGVIHKNDYEFIVEEIIKLFIKENNWNEINFENIRTDYVNLEYFIRKFANHGLKIFVERYEVSPYIKLNYGFERYLGNLSKNSKRQFFKKTRMLGNLGDLRFKIVKNFNSELLQEIVFMHTKRWSNKLIFPSFSDPRRKRFLLNISQRFAKRNILRIFCLYLNNELIAYRLGFLYKNIFFDWNTSFLIKYYKFSPGMVLLGKIISHLIDMNIDEFDFLRGAENYKLLWAKDMRNLYRIYGKRKNGITHFASIKGNISKPLILKNKKGIILDLDGVVYKGDKPIKPTIEGINYFSEKGIRIGFITNTSVKSVDLIRKKLRNFGILCDTKYIVTSSLAVAEFLLERKIKKCLVIGGEPVLPQLLLERKIKVVDFYENGIEAFVVGYTKNFNYRILRYAQKSISSGALFICTDRDSLFASGKEKKPGTGWIVSAIESVTDKSPIIIGKPNTYSIKLLIKKMKLCLDEVFIVGDNLESDILAGKNIGIQSCLLLGGVSSLKDIGDLPKSKRPDFVLNSFSDLINKGG